MLDPQVQRGKTLVVLAMALVGAVTETAAQGAPGKTTVETQLLVTGEPGLQYAVSPKGQHLAAVVLRGSRQVMVHDGVEGPKFDEILQMPNAAYAWDKVAWSEDGSRHAYAGRVGSEYVVMVDGKEVHRAPLLPQLTALAKSPVHQLGFSPGGKHWYLTVYRSAVTGSEEGQLILDGQEGPVGTCCASPVFSRDGDHHAYILERRSASGQRSAGLIVDGKVAPYLAGEPEFTGDGLHLFTKRPVPRTSLIEILADGQPFMRVEGGVQLYMSPVGPGVLGVAWTPFQNGVRSAYLLVGNRKVPGSECADNAGLTVYLSNDAKHYAARCRTWVMVDAKKGLEYAGGVSNVAFTADGRAVYQASSNGKTFMVVGDQESDGYFGIRPVDLQTRAQGNTTDLPPAVIRGNRVGYIAQTAPTATNFAVVVDGKSYPAVGASLLTFSPDGSRFAFLAGQPYASATVDGVAYPQITVDPAAGNIGRQGTFQWSADSKHVAWIAGNPVGVAVDGKLVTTEGTPRFLRFSADGRHLVWLTRGGPGHLVFVDGVKVLDLPANLPLENDADIYWSFGEDGSGTFAAQDGGAMKRFRIRPGSGTSVETLLAKAGKPR